MRDVAESWAVVLAGGEGRRLVTLTTDRDGVVIPKQYCSLRRQSCLLQDALHRAEAVALESRVCCVVAEEHRRWWMTATARVIEPNVFVQPKNKGTGVGILFALLKLEMINPDAIITLLPADHYFRDENVIRRALRIAANLASASPGSAYLLATDPEVADVEFGYILPADRVRDKPTTILGFAEKPALEHAEELIALGALWNLFIMVGTIRSLLALFYEKYEAEVVRMREAVHHQKPGDHQSMQGFYQTVNPIDFSADVLEENASRLEVVRVPHCGWTDLGTPRRVERILRHGWGTCGSKEPTTCTPLFWDLSTGLSPNVARQLVSCG